MRWDALFADLENQLVAERWETIEAEASELTRGQRAEVTLVQRFRAALGQRIRVTLAPAGELSELTLQSAGPEWLGGYDAAGSLLIPSPVVLAVEGNLQRADTAEPKLRTGVSIAAAYRALSRRREPVGVVGISGSLLAEGTIDVVGADHFDIAQHPRDEVRRRARSRKTIPFAAVQLVRAHYRAFD